MKYEQKKKKESFESLKKYIKNINDYKDSELLIRVIDNMRLACRCYDIGHFTNLLPVLDRYIKKYYGGVYAIIR